METATPLVAERIALNEKKVAMALDDLIKLSKSKTNVSKGKKPRRHKSKSQNFNGSVRNNVYRVQNYMSSISAVRQGAVPKRRSNFQVNQYPVTTNFARNAATAPPRAFNAGRITCTNQSRSSLGGAATLSMCIVTVKSKLCQSHALCYGHLYDWELKCCIAHALCYGHLYDWEVKCCIAYYDWEVLTWILFIVFITPPVQNRLVQARFIPKRQEAFHEKVENGGWRRKTLDSRFAIMKEQRKTHQSNNNYRDGVQVPMLPPWARARIFLPLRRQDT